MRLEINADDPIGSQIIAASTAGMTTKVIKGSMWTLAGSVAPLAVSLIATPFVIRFLGTESYGVLLLVGLIPMYFSFADFGMGIASTKFASEAYGHGDERKEAEVVWTAAVIAAISTLIIAVPIFLFSYPIVRLMNVPEHLLSTASIALKITSGSFFLGVLSSVLNSPMLARLRMDLNMLTSAIPKILLAAVTPVILYFGGGIVEAVSWAFIVSVGIVAVVIYFSSRLLPRLPAIAFNRNLVRPLIKFGGGLAIAAVASIFLANLEKLVLTSLISVEALAFYSVAFTLATMTTMFANSMAQSLSPGFFRLSSRRETGEYDALFLRAMRINLVGLFPVVMVLFVGARPFFTFWAGPEFGAQSTLPFYVLLAGLPFNIIMYIPHSTITASGRTDVFAKLYWVEFALYAVLVIFLVSWLGIFGAALAYTVRVIFDAFAIGWFSRRIAGVSFSFRSHLTRMAFGICLLLPPVLLAIYDNYSVWLFLLVPGCLAAYALVEWRGSLEAEERDRIVSAVHVGFKDMRQWLRSAARTFVRIPILGGLFRGNLPVLAWIFGTDKYGSHYYVGHYNTHFSARRRRRSNILEIGIGGYDDPNKGGSSLRMWKAYFPKSKIFGIDIYDKSAHDERRIKTFQGSQVDRDFLSKVVSEIGQIDIIIDDGSHLNEHVIETFQILFPALAPDGIYVIEDLQTSYWDEPVLGVEWGGSKDLNAPHTSINFLKRLVDGLNYSEFINQDYEPTYLDRNIVSVHFYHNLAFIYKGTNDEKSNLLT